MKAFSHFLATKNNPMYWSCRAKGANESIARRACEGAHQQWARTVGRFPCATPDLYLKHPDTTVATYKRRQMKRLKQASETLAKKPEKTFENHCKHMQYPD
jgi:hypothetical protein